MKKFLRFLIYRYDLLFYFYYRYIWKPSSSLDVFLNALSRKKKNFYFIHIGANDGVQNDPLYKYIRRDKWKGILVEPQKEICRRLRENYRNNQHVIIENAAIDHFAGERVLYKISFSNSRWASGLSSFLKEEVQKMIDAGYVAKKAEEEGVALPPDPADWIATEKIRCITFMDLVKQYNIEAVDLVMTDVEGYDFEIIKTIPFHHLKPEVIIYEHSHLAEKAREECRQYLESMGYAIVLVDESDTIAQLKQ